MSSAQLAGTVRNSRLLFQTTRKILAARENYECFILVLYAPNGWGKSVFSIKVLSQLYGIRKMVQVEDGSWQLGCTEPNWEAWKKWLGFLPAPMPEIQTPKSWGFRPPNFEEAVDHALRSGKQQLCYVSDDAGALYSKYRWQEEWAKRFSEEFDTIRSAFAGIIFTTADPRKLLTVLKSPVIHTGRISKATGNKYSRDWRYARIYEGWIAPDLLKTGKRTIIKSDWFRKQLPDKTWKEYDPVRRWYNKVLHERTKEARLRYGGVPMATEEELAQEDRTKIYPEIQGS